MDYQRLYEYRFAGIEQDTRAEVWREIAPFIHERLGRPQRVLDPAAGRGEFINAVPAAERWAVDAVAYEEGVLDPGVTAVVSDILEADLPAGHFNAVWVSNFLEHLLAQEDVYRFLRKMRSALAPGGRIAIMGPNIRYCAKEYWDCADHTLALTHVAIAEHLYTAGFQVAEINPRFLPYSFRSRFPPQPKLVRRYLQTPLAWRVAGKQFLVIGERDESAPMTATPEQPAGRLALTPDTVALGGLAVAILVAGVYLMTKVHAVTFFYDEWTFVQDRHAWTADAFLAAHNGHMVLLPVLVYKLLFATAGLGHYGAYRLAIVLAHLLCATLLFLLLRRRIGAPLATLGAVVLLFLGAAAQDILWPFQLTFLLSVAAGFGALLLLEGGTRRAEVGAAGLLVLAVAGGSIGLCFVAGVVVELALGPRWRERWWVVAAPLAVYALWWLGYHSGSYLLASNISHAPGFVANEAAATVAGLTALGPAWGRSLAVALVIWIVWRVSRTGALTPRVAMLATAVLVYWVLIALSRGQINAPGANRYLYPAAVFVLLLAAELLPRRPWSPAALIAGAVLALAIAIGGLLGFDTQADILRQTTAVLRPRLTSIELAHRTVAPGFMPDATRAPTLEAGKYLAAVKDIGSSPALTVAQLAGASEAERESADTGSLAALRVAVAPAPARFGRCAPATADVVVPSTGLVVRTRAGDAALSLRRFGTAFGAPFATVPLRSTVLVRITPDDSTTPWHLGVAGVGGPQVCPAA